MHPKPKKRKNTLQHVSPGKKKEWISPSRRPEKTKKEVENLEVSKIAQNLSSMLLKKKLPNGLLECVLSRK